MHGSHPPPYGGDGPYERARRPVDLLDVVLLLVPVAVVLAAFVVTQLL